MKHFFLISILTVLFGSCATIESEETNSSEESIELEIDPASHYNEALNYFEAENYDKCIEYCDEILYNCIVKEYNLKADSLIEVCEVIKEEIKYQNQ